MVWPFTSSSSSNDESKRDPLKDLDPGLRAFLERESPVKYTPPKPDRETPSEASKTSRPPQTPSPSTSQSETSTTGGNESPLPSNVPTLYKDGRYAHLWSSYKPLAQIENENTSPQDKLADILAGFRDRKASIGKAALENCAVEQFNLNDCYRNGDMSERFTNCRQYMKKLDRCYTMNQRLLRALGYLGQFDRPAEVEERIQMHADKLYQTMVAQEEVESRDEKAATSPPAESQKEQVEAEAQMKRQYDTGIDPAVQKIVEELRPQIRDRYKDRLRELKPNERPLEERALAMEMIAGKDVMKTVSTLREQGVEQKHERIEKGEGTMSDRISKFLGW